jgi:RNA polymerase sigma-70 factor (ECF subfamily)
MTPEEFRKTILPEGRRLYALAFRYLNNREEAEDTVQEVMMKLWAERDRKRDYASTAAWCTIVTRNHCIDALRRKKRIDFRDISEANSSTGHGTYHPGESDDQEAVQMIRSIISRMKEPYRSAVILRDMEGYSYEESAEAMQTSINTLRTILSRARKNIRNEMERLYNYGTGEDKRTARQV